MNGATCEAFGINNRGEVTGSSETAYGKTLDGFGHAFLYDVGALFDLGTLGGPLSFANDINNQGQIAGASLTERGGRCCGSGPPRDSD